MSARFSYLKIGIRELVSPFGEDVIMNLVCEFGESQSINNVCLSGQVLWGPIHSESRESIPPVFPWTGKQCSPTTRQLW